MDRRLPAQRALPGTTRWSGAIATTSAVLLLCLGATYAFWRHMLVDAENLRASAFHERVNEALHHVHARLERHRHLLQSIAALDASSSQLTHDQVHAYLDNLQLSRRSPEVRAVGIRVALADVAPSLMHAAGASGGGAGAARATPWSAATSMTARIPAGTDAGVEGNGRVALVARLPAQRGTAAGMGAWAFAEISVERMMRQLLDDDLSHAARDIDIGIYDGAVSPSSLLYGTYSTAPGAYGLTAVRSLEFAGREWTLVLRAMPGFRAARENFHPPLFAGFAALCSVLMGGLTWSLATGRDRARRTALQINEALIQSESRLRSLNRDLEGRIATRTGELRAIAERLTLSLATSATGLWDWDVRTAHVHYSPEWARQLGYEPHEIGDRIGEWERRLHADDRERVLGTLREQLARPSGMQELEYRAAHRDGSYRTLLCRFQVYADDAGSAARVIASHIDITERKATEDALRRLTLELRAAWRQVSNVEEADRRWLASELHDSIGAALTALNLNLTLIRERLPEGSRPAIEPPLNDSLTLLEETVENIRAVMAKLRPPVLDDYGLATALRWYVDRINGRGARQIRFSLRGADERLGAETEIALFRIAQAALANVEAHAAARHVAVELEVSAHEIVLAIADDGCGFAMASSMEGGRPHWGLVTMRERAESIGGHCTVDSTPGRGTRVLVRVPR